MFSKKSDYGIQAVLFLAANSDESHLLGSSDISKQLGISEPMLSKVLQHLTKKKFVGSKKGRNGGFFMTEWQKNQTLIQIIMELENSHELMGKCLMSLDRRCTDSNCPYHNHVSIIKEKLSTIYNTDTIKETAIKLNFNNKALINR